MLIVNITSSAYYSRHMKALLLHEITFLRSPAIHNGSSLIRSTFISSSVGPFNNK